MREWEAQQLECKSALIKGTHENFGGISHVTRTKHFR